MNLNKTVIVTGASRGIGKETVKKFAENNFEVIAISRDIDLLIKNFNNYNNVINYQLDITNYEQIEKFAKEIENKKIFALINNAGGGKGGSEPQNWNYSYELNVLGPMHLTNKLINQIDKNGIVFTVTSLIAYDYEEHVESSYVVAKSAEVMFSKILNKKLRYLGIRCCEIVPGSVRSDTQPKDSALNSEDIAECIYWITNLKRHINIDSIKMSVCEERNNFLIKNIF